MILYKPYTKKQNIDNLSYITEIYKSLDKLEESLKDSESQEIKSLIKIIKKTLNGEVLDEEEKRLLENE